ncbi:hypothetical protein DRJ48_01005 [Candidatus Woesearchaeota archaeon]|nr:MAG: hypothetical protein DRJ48_01005 [Candidatus Woesearchaeota archaeon]
MFHYSIVELNAAPLERLRREVVNPELDEIVTAANELYRRCLMRVLMKHGIPGRVVINGSTNKRRGTYVLDPKALDRAFPPDIDLCVIVDDSISNTRKEKELEQRLLQVLQRRRCSLRSKAQ